METSWKDTRAPKFRLAWDLHVLGINGSGVLTLVVFLSELFLFS